ncbi:MAG: Membrane protein [uncultured Sphingomonas sp.]|uniref:Membrane protein n=1 Tax=uncultured Sphingomonas sp. TaxID=158754 RepID=A0A6J4T767_9SPHN|nr:MAG: Membrane protein [uncultured Sphingomonas sp.]
MSAGPGASEPPLPNNPSHRYQSLDAVRGVAVMGILIANMPGFALPAPAYFSPLAWGGTGPADLTAWFTTFVLIEGKMRGLFSFLFGASILLVIDRAQAAGQSAAAVHLGRMAVLLLIGLAHRYLIWWGDILAHYALVGAVAFIFVRLDQRRLLAAGLVVLVMTLAWNASTWNGLLWAGARSTPAQVEIWSNFAWAFGVPPSDWSTGEIAAMRASWSEQIAWRWQYLESEVSFLSAVGLETLAAMLLGMAAFRSGFLTGEWERAQYRHFAAWALGATFLAYALLALNTMWHGFDQRWVFFGSVVGTVPFRVLGAAGYAACIILLLRPGGSLTERVSAVGRAAFTNYLGTSLIVTGIFYGWGFGLFGTLSRAEIYIVPPLVWALMLTWSKPWLERYRYGPLEWLWRSLARLELQPMLRSAAS